MERKLETIQKQQNLNEVFAVGVSGPGGANHFYRIREDIPSPDPVPACEWNIQFQIGPRKENYSVAGITDQDLLEIVRDRLTCFQLGEYACTYNEEALIYVTKALECLNQRVEDRINRNVLGTYQK